MSTHERPVVLVDMDGVLADFDGATSTYLRDHHPEIPIIIRQNFYYRDDYPDPLHQAIINELHASQGFFRDLPLMPGALEGWAKIEALGFQPQICTSPLSSNEWCPEEKRDWLMRKMGTGVAGMAIIDKNKENHKGIALIDDRPEIKNADKATWTHVVFDDTYNQDSSAPLRLHGWQDENLEAILAECLARSL